MQIFYRIEFTWGLFRLMRYYEVQLKNAFLSEIKRLYEIVSKSGNFQS